MSDRITCARVRDEDPFGVREMHGSQKRRCSLCRELVWVAPTGQALIAERDLEIVCMECAARAFDPDDPEDRIEPWTADQVAEVVEHLRRRSRGPMN